MDVFIQTKHVLCVCACVCVCSHCLGGVVVQALLGLQVLSVEEERDVSVRPLVPEGHQGQHPGRLVHLEPAGQNTTTPSRSIPNKTMEK